MKQLFYIILFSFLSLNSNTQNLDQDTACAKIVLNSHQLDFPAWWPYGPDDHKTVNAVQKLTSRALTQKAVHRVNESYRLGLTDTEIKNISAAYHKTLEIKASDNVISLQMGPGKKTVSAHWVLKELIEQFKEEELNLLYQASNKKLQVIDDQVDKARLNLKPKEELLEKYFYTTSFFHHEKEAFPLLTARINRIKKYMNQHPDSLLFFHELNRNIEKLEKVFLVPKNDLDSAYFTACTFKLRELLDRTELYTRYLEKALESANDSTLEEGTIAFLNSFISLQRSMIKIFLSGEPVDRIFRNNPDMPAKMPVENSFLSAFTSWETAARSLSDRFKEKLDVIMEKMLIAPSVNILEYPSISGCRYKKKQ